MAESSVTIYGNPIDVFTQTDGKQRQIMTIGDPSTQANVTGVALKGIQSTYAMATQDMKDSGRTLKVFSASFTAATTEALVTLTPVGTGAAGTTGTSFTITSGKTFRIQTVSVTTKNAGAAAQGVICNLRVANTTVTATSPVFVTVGVMTVSAATGATASNMADIPDGLELPSSFQFGISQVGTATAGNTVTIVGYEY